MENAFLFACLSMLFHTEVYSHWWTSWYCISWSILPLPCFLSLCISSPRFISGDKIWRWLTYYASSRLLMVRSHWGFSSVRNNFAVFVSTGSLYTNHYPLRLLNNPPIPFRDASVTPFQFGECGLISFKCVCLIVNEVIKPLHMFCLSWTCGITIRRLSYYVLNLCWSLIHIPAYP